MFVTLTHNFIRNMFQDACLIGKYTIMSFTNCWFISPIPLALHYKHSANNADNEETWSTVIGVGVDRHSRAKEKRWWSDDDILGRTAGVLLLVLLCLTWSGRCLGLQLINVLYLTALSWRKKLLWTFILNVFRRCFAACIGLLMWMVIYFWCYIRNNRPC